MATQHLEALRLHIIGVNGTSLSPGRMFLGMTSGAAVWRQAALLNSADLRVM